MKLKENVIAIVHDLIVLNEMAPMGYFLGKKFVLVDIFNLIKNSELTRDIKSKLEVIVFDQKNTSYYRLLFLIQRLLIKLRINNEYLNKYIHTVRTKEISKIFISVIVPLHSIKNFKYLLVRPGNDLLVKQLIHDFKKNGFKGKVIGISEAIPALSNLNHDKGNYIHQGEDRYFNKTISIVHDCDQLILNSKTTLNKFRKIGISWENKIRIMKSFRNTKEWQKLISRRFSKRNFLYRKKRVLFLHSNFKTNINQEEIRRSIRIVELNDNLEIGFRPHIRNGKLNDWEEKYLFKDIRKYKVFKESLTEAIMWSDICVFYGSSASIDALMLGKYTIFIRYGTSNTISETIKPYVTFCDNPDDFINECSNLNESKIISNTNKLFPLENANDLRKKWINFLK